MPRELIDTGRDKRFVRRDERGRFKDVVDVGRSLVQDRKRQATHVVPAGEGDRGDQQPRSRTTRNRSGAPARPRTGRTAAKPKARTRARGAAAKRSRRR